MAPQAENEKKIQDELLKRLKLEEEKEKKKLEKEAKRRAELEKIKSESLVIQANLLVPSKKEKQPVQQKKPAMNSQIKTSQQRKQQSHNSGNKNNQGLSEKPKTTSAWNKKQPTHLENRYRRDSSSSENSWKRNDYGSYQSSSKHGSTYDSMWDNKNDHFPMLGAEAPVPEVNVWEERKYKQQEIQSLQPQNKYDEDAMLRQALALSMMEAAREEEQKQKLDEEYKLQMETLGCNSESSDNFGELDNLTTHDTSQHESLYVSESTERQSHGETVSRNMALSSVMKKNKTSSVGGAKPKINKIIDNFGGWGLKDNSRKNSYSLSNFSNDDDENSSEDPWYSNPSGTFQKDLISSYSKKQESDSNWEICDTDIKNPVVSDLYTDAFSNDGKMPPASDSWEKTRSKKQESVNNWELSDTDIKTPVVSDLYTDAFGNDGKMPPASDSWENEVVHDKKVVSYDNNNIKSSHLSSTTDHYGVSSKEKECLMMESNAVTDKKLSFSDKPGVVSSQWDDNFSREKLNVIRDLNRKEDYVKDQGISCSNNTITKWENEKSSLLNNKSVRADTVIENSSYKHDMLGVPTKVSTAKDTSTSSHNTEKQRELSSSNILSQFESTYNYVLGDTDTSKDEFAAAKNYLSTDDIWSDKSSNKLTASNYSFQNKNSLQSEFSGVESPFKYGAVEENILKPVLPNEEIDTPPILPPHSVPVKAETNETNQTVTAEISSNGSTEKSPPVLPPLQMPSPYVIPPLCNPTMFPGVTPMFGIGMDPIIMRQMLMLSNPFFASQLLTMEQYYRALGMPVDLFSYPTQTVPNVPFPGIANLTEQNIAVDSPNVNVSSSHDVINNQKENKSDFLSENLNSASSEKQLPKYPPGLDNNTAANVIHTVENDPWSNVLSSDTQFEIPPPKPPAFNIDSHILPPPIPRPFEMPQNDSSFSIHSKNSVSSNMSSNLLDGNSHKPISAVVTKSEVTGWGDLEGEGFRDSKIKTNSSNDDFGWGTDSLPAKSVKNPSMYEDKKVVHRQPARQPQLSRFQRNRRFN